MHTRDLMLPTVLYSYVITSAVSRVEEWWICLSTTMTDIASYCYCQLHHACIPRLHSQIVFSERFLSRYSSFQISTRHIL